MMVECTSGRLLHVVPVCVEPEVSGWLRFLDVLGVGASQCAFSKVHGIEALAIQAMQDFEGFPCGAAAECLGGLDVLAAEVFSR